MWLALVISTFRTWVILLFSLLGGQGSGSDSKAVSAASFSPLLPSKLNNPLLLSNTNHLFFFSISQKTQLQVWLISFCALFNHSNSQSMEGLLRTNFKNCKVVKSKRKRHKRKRDGVDTRRRTHKRKRDGTNLTKQHKKKRDGADKNKQQI